MIMYSTTTYSPLSYFSYDNPTISFSYNGKTIKEMAITVGDSIALAYYVNNPSRLNLYYEHYNSNSYVASTYCYNNNLYINTKTAGTTYTGITLNNSYFNTIGGSTVKVIVYPQPTPSPGSTPSPTPSPTPFITPTPTPISTYFYLDTLYSYVSH